LVDSQRGLESGMKITRRTHGIKDRVRVKVAGGIIS
jgi:hypothetical protein